LTHQRLSPAHFAQGDAALAKTGVAAGGIADTPEPTQGVRTRMSGLTVSRRAVLATGGATLLAAAAARQETGGRADPAALLPTSSYDSLTGFIRMFAGLTGSSVFANEGLIYGKVEGQLPKPLFGFVSVIEVRARQVAPGMWRSEQKEAMTCLDMTTRMPLRSFRNPYTNEDNVVLGYVSPVNVYFFDGSGSGFRGPPKPGQTSRLWRSSATDVWVTESRYNEFPSSITEAEFPRSYAGPIRHSVDILTYRARAADFADARQTSVPGTLTMVSDTPWPLWMMMGKRGGSAIYHGSGQKYRSLADLAPITRRAIEAAYPTWLADPWNFASEPWGTAAQMRRLRAAGRM